MNAYAVILVDSTSHALKIEKGLGKAGIVCRLVPVPRTLSSDCGVCVRIAGSDLERARTILGEVHIETAGFHMM